MAVPEDTGYPLRWFKQQDFVRNLYECAICLEVVKDAVQIRDCGHQFCRYCLDSVLRSNERPECPTCRNRISNEVVSRDIAAIRAIGNFDVNCPNNGCEWDGTLNSLLQEHIGMCPFLLLHCSNAACNEQVTRRDLAAHLTGCEYGIVICQYCNSEHVFKDQAEHLRKCFISPIGCINGCPQTIPRNQMEEHLKTECSETVVKCKFAEFGCNSECQRCKLEEHLNQAIKDHLELLRDKYEKSIQEMKQKYEKDIQEMKRKCEHYEEDMEEMKQKCEQYGEDMEEMKQKIIMCDQNEKDIRKMKQKINFPLYLFLLFSFLLLPSLLQGFLMLPRVNSTLSAQINTASYLMIIKDFNKKLLEAKNSNSNGEISSDPFYSSPYGYKMKLIVYLHEIRQQYKNHMGVYLTIMESDHDAILSWPFKKKYTFTLFDQQDDEKERENIVYTVTPGSQNHAASKRPLLDKNPGWGRPKFVSHETLQTRKYIKDNTVFIKLSIET